MNTFYAISIIWGVSTIIVFVMFLFSKVVQCPHCDSIETITDKDIVHCYSCGKDAEIKSSSKVR